MRMTNRNDIEQLFKSHYVQMHRMAVVLLHDDDLARDIVHDVFATLLDNPTDFILSGGYLIKAVRNRCLNHIRDCEIHKRIEKSYFLEIDDYDRDDRQDEDTVEHIRRLISSELPPRTRQIIDLRFRDGLRFAEIATEMKLSETAVYRHIRHALTIIRQKLNQNG